MQIVIVIESGLSANSVGAKISTTEPLEEASALELFERIGSGGAPEVFKPHRNGITVRVNDRQFLDITPGRTTPARQSRITLTELVADRR